MKETIFLNLIQNNFKILLISLGYFEINHWFINKDQLMLKNIFPGNICLALVSFSDFNLVVVVLAKSKKALICLFIVVIIDGRWWCCCWFIISCWRTDTFLLSEYFYPVINPHVITHVSRKFLIVVLKLFCSNQWL